MPAGRFGFAFLGVGILAVLCACSTHANPPIRVATTSEAAWAYQEGPVTLRLGDTGGLLLPEDCRAQCAGSAFAQVVCPDALVEVRSPAWPWPSPQNEDRFAGGAVAQWGQHGNDFLGVLLAPGGHFALVQWNTTEVGRSRVLKLLRSYHVAQAPQSQINCPALIY